MIHKESNNQLFHELWKIGLNVTLKYIQFIVTTAKGLQNFLKYFQLFSGNSKWELHIVTTFKLIGSFRSSFWL